MLLNRNFTVAAKIVLNTFAGESFKKCMNKLMWNYEYNENKLSQSLSTSFLTYKYCKSKTTSLMIFQTKTSVHRKC